MNLKHIFLYLGVISAFLSAPMAVQGAAAAPRRIEAVDGGSSVKIDLDPATTRLLPGYYSKSLTSGYTAAPMLAGVGVLAHIASFGLSHYLKRVESERAALLEKELKGDTPLTIEEDTRLQKLHTNRKTLQRVITILRGGGYSLLFVASLVYFMTRNKYKTVGPYLRALEKVLICGATLSGGSPRISRHDDRVALVGAGQDVLNLAADRETDLRRYVGYFLRQEILYGAEPGNARLDERVEWAHKLSVAEDKIKSSQDNEVVYFVEELLNAGRATDVIDLYKNHFSDRLKNQQSIYFTAKYWTALLLDNSDNSIDDLYKELGVALDRAEENATKGSSRSVEAARYCILQTLCQIYAAGRKEDTGYKEALCRLGKLFGVVVDSGKAMPESTSDASHGGGAPGGTVGPDAGNELMTDAVSHTLRVSETAGLVINCLLAENSEASECLNELAGFIRLSLEGEQGGGLTNLVQSNVEFKIARRLLTFAYQGGALEGDAQALLTEFKEMDSSFSQRDLLRLRGAIASFVRNRQRAHGQAPVQ